MLSYAPLVNYANRFAFVTISLLKSMQLSWTITVLNVDIAWQFAGRMPFL